MRNEIQIRHGNERNNRMVTESRNVRTFVHAITGEEIATMPTSTFSRTVSEKFCEKCGWIECDGFSGIFGWIATHENHNEAEVK
jgi:hypothetical protein